MPKLSHTLLAPGLLAAVLLLPAASAWAQKPAAVPLGSGAHHSFALRNLATHAIVEAQGRMQGGQDQDFTHGNPIQPSEGREIVVPVKVCLSGLTIKFDNGQTLQRDKLNDCDLTQIIVRDAKIDVTNSAMPPGGK